MKTQVLSILDLHSTMVYDRDIERDKLFSDIKGIWEEFKYLTQTLKFGAGRTNVSTVTGQKHDLTIGVLKNKIKGFKCTQGKYAGWTNDTCEGLWDDIQKLEQKIGQPEYFESCIMADYEPGQGSMGDSIVSNKYGHDVDEIDMFGSMISNKVMTDQEIAAINHSGILKSKHQLSNLPNHEPQTPHFEVQNFSNVDMGASQATNKENFSSNLKGLSNAHLFDEAERLYGILKFSQSSQISKTKLHGFPGDPNPIQKSLLPNNSSVLNCSSTQTPKFSISQNQPLYDYCTDPAFKDETLLDLSHKYQTLISRLAESHLALNQFNIKILEIGGMQCSWPDEDHQIFLKVIYSTLNKRAGLG
jgi:hypothetical protein